MRDLRINCIQFSADFMHAGHLEDSNLIQIDIFEGENGASVQFDEKKARQLHEWLGRYLENSDG